ncbi:Rne/Rng family ribonuclease [Caulobacter sp. SLTY]|uniref:Rne/Rng family ribonuclease n=1 Tax=Caulobacter sp. SLTY TaxID=2683262 RepID=UPI00141324CC|nr:ribonuclease E/G [Caulobacter sp. SLTY]NBB15833.1 Rne/Rng family ribonuclease [Caulobacter sp. SLTY]
MTKKMLIDAAHAEETRVVVMDGSRIEEFDFESQSRKQLRGNIYLAKVTRVEPSLQAAFIEYGGNRHGFLAFNEIHPDYYQIPLADREALTRELAEDDEDEPPRPKRDRGRGRGLAKPVASEEAEADPVLEAEDSEEADENAAHAEDAHQGDHGGEDNGHDEGGREERRVETTGADDDEDDMEEEVERRRRRLMRKYKIQDVIRRRQIMLVQVVKEERGNKGAALTTYLSLAGRYGVLMPNTDRGGGISRKIVSATDRKRLKTIVQGLNVPKGLGLIVRTAGAKRTKAEISRDYEYLMRLWENIRDTTLGSVAPALIYEEEDLVKRAIRDLFDKDIDSVQVEGEAGYKEARDFMRMIMPAQAKKVVAYREPTPLFVAHRIESQLSQIYSPVVPLRSGGYLVINQTEALVAIDVNSGKATRERNIEATALKTNLEAAEEACRQLRLRDLAGLIVIDFIDMEESKNNRAVEKVLKDNLKDDRARVQMGRISAFGLMEISRQRRRTGVLEGTTHTCPHCEGMGRVRSVESSALSALRAVEMEALRGGGELTLKVPAAVGLYILNEKRGHLARIHAVHHLYVTIQIDESLAHADHELERTSLGEHSLHALDSAALAMTTQALVEDDDFVPPEEDEDEDEIIPDDEDEDAPREARREAGPRRDEDERGRRGRGRRRRGGRRDEEGDAPREAAPVSESDEEIGPEGEDEYDKDGRRRRRGRRGGRRSREEDRPRDGFAWARPRVPFGDDPFQWHDPAKLEGGGMLAVRTGDEPHVKPEVAEDDEGPTPIAREERGGRGRGRNRRDRRDRGPREVAAEAPLAAEEAESADTFVDPPISTIAAGEPFTDEVWVELPSEPEPAKKPRRSRAKGKKAEEAPDAEAVPEVVEAAPDVVEAAPEPEAPAPEPEPQPEPEPVVVAAPEPAAVKEPDPNEITAPPEKPKKGWWRR